MKKLALIVIIILIAALAVVWVSYQKKQSQQAAAPASSLGAQLYTQTQNPVQGKVPETNPFNQKTNPFDQ